MTVLADLVRGSGITLDDRWVAQPVTGAAIDHRQVLPATLFGAFPGARVNGEDFIPAAVAAGAVAVVARAGAVVAGAAHLASDNPRQLFARLAASLFAPFPTTCAAVTGTNGKTSTAELTRQLWHLGGARAASVGTLGIATAQGVSATGMTTPDIVRFLGTMAGLAREGISHVVFEASSHGLDQHRCEGVPVRAAAFTNLSRDHLDYHGDMDRYLAAKCRLFRDVLADDGTAVLWADDPHTAAVEAALRGSKRTVLRIGRAGDALRLMDAAPTRLGQRLTVDAGGAVLTIDLPLIGAYQAANALLAAGLVIATGGDPAVTLAHLARVQGVPGRLEQAAITAHGVPAYVDYAHTPDAVTAVLDALRAHAAAAGMAGRIIIVLGAGGDRDTGKRAAMGAAAAAGADLVIVTDDNPRSEDPAAIRAAVRVGAPDALDIGDRRAAIAAAIAAVQPGDMLCIAGKGHEQGQVYGTGADARTMPFDDRQVARECAA